jgi:hypothetical protein
MFPMIRSLVLALSVAGAGWPVTATALTVTGLGTAGGVALATTEGGAATTVTFDWANVSKGSPGSAFVAFTLAGDGVLSFDSYARTSGSGVSGLVLYRVGAATRLTGNGSCNDGKALAEVRGRCDSIAAAGADHAPGVRLFDAASGFTAGDYILGFFEKNNRSAGSAAFTLAEASPVPTPAAALLLGGLMAGLVWRARRRAA